MALVSDVLHMLMTFAELVYSLVLAVFYLLFRSNRIARAASSVDLVESDSKYTCNQADVTQSCIQMWQEKANDLNNRRKEKGLAPYALQLMDWQDGTLVWRAVQKADNASALPKLGQSPYVKLPPGFTQHKWYMTHSLEWMPDAAAPNLLKTSHIAALIR